MSAAVARPDDVAVGVEGEEAKASNVNVLVCSWNVGNAPPPEDLSPWLPAGGGDYDIIAVGVQESKYTVKGEKGAVMSTPALPANQQGDESKTGERVRVGLDAKEPESVSAQHFFKVVQLHVGGEYYTVAKTQLWEMRLIVLAKVSLRPQVHDVHKAWEATGALSVCGNKGGLVVKFDVGPTSLCFVSCHLAAHAPKLEHRNQNIEEVLQEIRMGPRPSIDIDNQFHHVFWFGDLNYRVQLNILDQKERELKAHIAEVKELIAAEQWHALVAADQLQQQMRDGIMLPGFTELTPTFPPTFKVERKPGIIYQTGKLRVPSYCDRVLWKSMAGRAADVRAISFSAFPEIFTSDHKPVSAGFQIRSVAPPKLLKPKMAHTGPQILITGLRAKKLHRADANGLADPYIVFESDPPNLFSADPKKPVKTAVVFKNLSPRFNDDQVPLLRARVSSKAELKRCSIIFCVWDYDRLTPDDPMGQCSLSLSRYCRSGPCDFKLPVSRHGVVRGHVQGFLEVIWPDDARHTAGTERNAGLERPGLCHNCCTVQ